MQGMIWSYSQAFHLHNQPVALANPPLATPAKLAKFESKMYFQIANICILDNVLMSKNEIMQDRLGGVDLVS